MKEQIEALLQLVIESERSQLELADLNDLIKNSQTRIGEIEAIDYKRDIKDALNNILNNL